MDGKLRARVKDKQSDGMIYGEQYVYQSGTRCDGVNQMGLFFALCSAIQFLRGLCWILKIARVVSVSIKGKGSDAVLCCVCSVVRGNFDCCSALVWA